MMAEAETMSDGIFGDESYELDGFDEDQFREETIRMADRFRAMNLLEPGATLRLSVPHWVHTQHTVPHFGDVVAECHDEDCDWSQKGR